MSMICLHCGENETPEGQECHRICDPCFNNAGEYIEANIHLIKAIPGLLDVLEASRLVIANWENASLAAAIRSLDRITLKVEKSLHRTSRFTPFSSPMSQPQISQAHTTGPWHVEVESDDSNNFYAELKGDGGSKPIARIYTSFYSDEHEIDSEELERDAEEYAANARLIAAAPDLLEVCGEYAEACRTRIEILEEEMQELGLVAGEPDARDLEDQIDHWAATKRMVEQVIAKATAA
jgi:hypothetical protein